jgi:hypothetical protein
VPVTNQNIPDPYNILTNKQAFMGRRTSCAFGLDVKEKTNGMVYNYNIQRRKDQARQRLVKKLLGMGTWGPSTRYKVYRWISLDRVALTIAGLVLVAITRVALTRQPI